jgi:pyrroloquinoline-quinone synthase
MDILARLDQQRHATNVLEHPFYERWSAGELSAGELSLYAGEYRHAVLALAEASRLAAAKSPQEHTAGLERHAAEEAEHVALWDRFMNAVCSTFARAPKAEPLEQTARCGAAWSAGDDVLEHLAVLYAVEASQPEIARTKLEGLVEHYGYTLEGPALEYFRLHERLDVEHARQGGELIERLLGRRADGQAIAARMLARAQTALCANWELLSGVEAAR